MKFKFLFRFAALLVAALTVTSCVNDDTTYYVPNNPVAYGYVVNASPSSGDLFFYADQNQLNADALNYGGSVGYLRFYLGERTFSLKNAAGTTLGTTALTLADGDFFGLYAVNNYNNIELVAYRDTLVTPQSGNARVRFINLSPDAPAIDVATTTATLATGLNFKDASPFIEVPAAAYDLTFKNTSTGATITTDLAETFTAGYIYTVYLKGYVTPPAGSNDTFSAAKLTNYRG